MILAARHWQPDGDGWLVRQQSWGEPSAFPFSGAVCGMGRLYAVDEAAARRIDAHCSALRGADDQFTLPLAA